MAETYSEITLGAGKRQQKSKEAHKVQIKRNQH